MRARAVGVVIVAWLFTACVAAPAPSSTSTSSISRSDAPASTSAPSQSPSDEARLPRGGGPPKPLEPGTYLSPDGFEPTSTVTVPDGWYGGGGASGFGVGQGVDEVNERFRDGSVYVDVIDMELDDAVDAFAELDASWNVDEPTSDKVDGHDAVTFHARAWAAPVLLDEALGIGVDISSDALYQTFVDVDGTTLLIRVDLYERDAELTVERVVASLQFLE